MKFQKTIPVMGKEYNLLSVTELDSDGLHDPKTSTISILQDGSQTEAELLHTLIHELGHALLCRTGITQGLSDGLEEAIVQSYANMFTELFSMKLKVAGKKKDVEVPKIAKPKKPLAAIEVSKSLPLV